MCGLTKAAVAAFERLPSRDYRNTAMSKRTTCVSWCCIVWALATCPAAATTITVGPYVPSATSSFLVPIVVSGATNLTAFSFDLAYDAAAFSIATNCDPFGDPSCDFVTGPVTPGGFHAGASFPALFVPGFILLDGGGAQTGRLLAVAGAWQDFTPAPSGDGVLAFVEFLAVPGASPGSPIVVTDAFIGSVPEPAIDLLLVAALGPLLMIRRRRTAAATRTLSLFPLTPPEGAFR